MLTDGDVKNKGAVIAQAAEYSDTIRVMAFGLGSGCDKDLVGSVAEAGNGTGTIVEDSQSNMLSGIVIRELAKAIEPHVKASYGFSDQMSKPRLIYRNTLLS